MKIAVIGSGGREHAIIWKLSQYPEQYNFFAFPGNGGTAALAKNVPIDTNDMNKLVEEIKRVAPDFVIVGPEIPLANGVVDLLSNEKIPCFGPVKAAAQIEASKAFAKKLMQSANIPTADFEVFDDFDALNSFVLQSQVDAWVVKADGLAAGKGVIVCSNKDEVLTASHNILSKGIFGQAGKKVVLEKRLYGREASAHFLCDGENFISLPPAQDYKRAFDNDEGSNTGGMGTFSPARHLTPEIVKTVEESIVKPLLKELNKNGFPYRGALYVGLILTDEGPKVIEFNCRFGDPETQVMLPIWNGDLLNTMQECSAGKLRIFKSKITQSAVCVVLAAHGYPDNYKKNLPLNTINDTENSLTFHAGTKFINGNLLSMGGRVLNAVGLGESMNHARNNAYALAEQLAVEGLRYRRDIAAS